MSMGCLWDVYGVCVHVLLYIRKVRPCCTSGRHPFALSCGGQDWLCRFHRAFTPDECEFLEFSASCESALAGAMSWLACFPIQRSIKHSIKSNSKQSPREMSAIFPWTHLYRCNDLFYSKHGSLVLLILNSWSNNGRQGTLCAIGRQAESLSSATSRNGRSWRCHNDPNMSTLELEEAVFKIVIDLLNGLISRLVVLTGT